MAPSGPLGWGHHPLWKEIGAPQKKKQTKKEFKKKETWGSWTRTSFL